MKYGLIFLMGLVLFGAGCEMQSPSTSLAVSSQIKEYWIESPEEPPYLDQRTPISIGRTYEDGRKEVLLRDIKLEEAVKERKYTHFHLISKDFPKEPDHTTRLYLMGEFEGTEGSPDEIYVFDVVTRTLRNTHLVYPFYDEPSIAPDGDHILSLGKVEADGEIRTLTVIDLKKETMKTVGLLRKEFSYMKYFVNGAMTPTGMIHSGEMAWNNNVPIISVYSSADQVKACEVGNDDLCQKRTLKFKASIDLENPGQIHEVK